MTQTKAQKAAEEAEKFDDDLKLLAEDLAAELLRGPDTPELTGISQRLALRVGASLSADDLADLAVEFRDAVEQGPSSVPLQLLLGRLESLAGIEPPATPAPSNAPSHLTPAGGQSLAVGGDAVTTDEPRRGTVTRVGGIA